MAIDPLLHPESEPSRAQKRFAIFFTIFALLFFVVGGFFLRRYSTGSPSSGASGDPMNQMTGAGKSGLASRTINGVTVTLSPSQLRNGQNDLVIEFKNSKGEYVDVGKVNLNLEMNMPGMMMHGDTSVAPTGKTGRYKAAVKPTMVGDWQ